MPGVKDAVGVTYSEVPVTKLSYVVPGAESSEPPLAAVRLRADARCTAVLLVDGCAPVAGEAAEAGDTAGSGAGVKRPRNSRGARPAGKSKSL